MKWSTFGQATEEKVCYQRYNNIVFICINTNKSAGLWPKHTLLLNQERARGKQTSQPPCRDQGLMTNIKTAAERALTKSPCSFGHPVTPAPQCGWQTHSPQALSTQTAFPSNRSDLSELFFPRMCHLTLTSSVGRPGKAECSCSPATHFSQGEHDAAGTQDPSCSAAPSQSKTLL